MTTPEQGAPPNRGRGSTALQWRGAIALALGLIALVAAQGVLAQNTLLAVDADPEGNSPTQIDQINSCIAVATSDSFDIDIVVEDVDQLLAWEIYFEYNPAIVEVIGRDVRLFQEANPGSAVFDVSERLPDSDGVYRLAAADTADPSSPDSGSGALTRLTLRAIGPGISPASLARRDLNDDGKLDQAPFLRNVDAEPIGDDNGDTFFDGSLLNAQIAVDTSCPNGSAPIASADDGGVRSVYVLASALAAAAVAAIGATVFLYRRRAGAQPH